MAKSGIDVTLTKQETMLIYGSLMQARKVPQHLGQNASEQQKKNMKENLKTVKALGTKLEKKMDQKGWDY